MAKKSDNLFVGLDIGTTKVSVVIAKEDEADKKPNIIGVGKAPNNGMRRGEVIDLEETTSAIAAAIEEAERVGGVSVSEATVSVNGANIASMNSRGTVAVSRADQEISYEDIIRVEQNAQAIALPPNRDILHVIPRVYTVDGHEGIKDPMGMQGSRLEVEAHVIMGPSGAIRNLDKAITQVGLSIEGQVLAPLAAAKAVLEKRDKELGSAVIDIGGGTTGLAIFEEGNILFSSILPIGSLHITNDLAIGLKTKVDVAEAVKIKYGHATPEDLENKEMLDLSELDKALTEKVDPKLIARIVEARLEEIFKMVRAELKKVNRDGRLPGGVVLTGGGAKLAGLEEFVRKYLGLPVRIGYPLELKGFSDKTHDPAFATTVGLMLYSYENKKLRSVGGPFRGVTARLKKVFKTLMP